MSEVFVHAPVIVATRRFNHLGQRRDMDLNEIDLEFMEQDAEERLTQREAALLGLPADFDKPDSDMDTDAFLVRTLF